MSSSRVRRSHRRRGGCETLDCTPRAAAAALTILLGAALAACSSGSGGSDVGAHTGIAPTARPQILNGGPSTTFREGAEVLLTGKASEDADGPLIEWHWRQLNGPAVQLKEGNSTSVSFTAPHVDAPTVLTFELTVKDSSRDTGRASIDVTVVPARDSNKFLSLDVRSGATFDGFKVVAALAGGAQTGPLPKPFTLSALAYLVYPPRLSTGADCTIHVDELANGVPAMTAGGCFVELLEDLTPAPLSAGGTGLAGEWPANVDAPLEGVTARMERWWNPRFALTIPRLDARAFNQRFVDSNERDRILEPHAAHAARVVLSLTLTAADNQQDATLILTDLTNVPIEVPNPLAAAGGPATTTVVENAGVGLPTAVLVPQETLLGTIAGRESALTAAVYYRTIDPNGTRTTLNAWLEQAGFASDGNGTLKPEAVAGSGEFAQAVYLNNFDLGFGRRMHMRTDAYGNVFSFVKNYTTLEGAIRGIDSFATVVMEYSPLLGPADPGPKLVKFFTYVEDGSGDELRVSSFDFDGRGERHTPGNCVSCHGGAKPPGVGELVFDAACGDPAAAACYAWPSVNRDGADIAGGDLSATFLPWDLESLLFADTDPAIVAAPVPFDGVTLGAELRRDYGDFSRASQLAQIKKLNQGAYSTYPDTPRMAAVRALLAHWHGGVDAQGLLIGDFDDSTAPPGWRNGELVPDPEDDEAVLTNPADAEQLYQQVYAQHCRSCHTSIFDEALQFDTYPELLVQEQLAAAVFGSGTMPAARLTMDRFWAPFDGGEPPGSLLAAHVARASGEDAPAAPGRAEAGITGLDPPSTRNDTVYLDGAASSIFAGSFAWSLVPPAGSAATLVGATTQYPMFTIDVPGTYAVTLQINAGTAAESTVTTNLDVANRAPAAADDLYALTLVDSTQLQASVHDGAHQDFDLDHDPLTITLAASGAPSHGSVTIGPDGTFMYVYTGDLVNPPASDSFRYAISDGFGGVDEGLVTILLNGAAAADRPTPPQLIGAIDASTRVGAGSTFAVELDWLASSDDAGVVGYNIYRDGSLLAFLPSAVAAGEPVTYVDAAVQPGSSHSYRVSALNAGNESTLSSEAGVSVASSLRLGIQTGWGDDAASLWGNSGCIGCHRGAPGGLTLRGNADEVFAELHEDAGGEGSRRIEPSAPAQSLLLCKPLISTDPAGCPHGGGDFYVKSDPRYQMLLRWIADDAPNN